ncbi:MAG: hypothetical protein RIR17_408, partial [Planctomycetota bacterium]
INMEKGSNMITNKSLGRKEGMGGNSY